MRKMGHVHKSFIFSTTFELKKACFEWFEGAMAHMYWRRPHLSVFGVQKDIWDVHGMIWMNWERKNAFEFKKNKDKNACFELCGVQKAYLSSRRPNLSVVMVKCILWLWTTWSERLKVKAYLKARGFIWVEKYPTWLDQGCKGTFENKRVYLSGFRNQDHTWEREKPNVNMIEYIWGHIWVQEGFN